MSTKNENTDPNAQLSLDLTFSELETLSSNVVIRLDNFRVSKQTTTKVISKKNSALSALLKEAESLKW